MAIDLEKYKIQPTEPTGIEKYRTDPEVSEIPPPSFFERVAETIRQGRAEMGEAGTPGEKLLAATATGGRAAGEAFNVFLGPPAQKISSLLKKGEEKIIKPFVEGLSEETRQRIRGTVEKAFTTKVPYPIDVPQEVKDKWGPEGISFLDAIDTWSQNRDPRTERILRQVLETSMLIPAAELAVQAKPLAKLAAGKTAQIGGEAIAVGGRALKGAGKELYKRAIPVSTAEAEAIVGYEANVPFLTRAKAALQGKTPPGAPRTAAETAFEEGLMGTEKGIGVEAKRASQKLWKEKVEPALDKSKAVMSKEELFNPIEERIARTVEPAKRQAYIDAYEALKEEYGAVNSFNLKQAQGIKTSLDRFTPEKVFRGKPIANEYRELQNDMANAIRYKIRSALGPEIATDYLDYGNFLELENLGVKALTGSARKGGFGSFWSSVYDMTTTPIKTVGGRTLYRVGDMFEFVGDKGIKKFGDYLRGQGLEVPVIPPTKPASELKIQQYDPK